MKRILGFTALFLFAAALYGQPSNPPRYIQGTTVAALPSAASQAHNVWTIHDGSSASDCTVGGGTTQVLCYSNGTTWAASGGSSGTVSSGVAGQIGYYSANGTSISGITTNVVYATAYGVKADAVSIHDATTVNGTAAITCPNSDCNFTAADVGKIVFATNATYDSTEWSSVVIVPRSTILSVVNANSITVSNNATASVTGAATVVYGTLDSAAYNATQSTGNDPLFAAWTAASNACLPLQLPAGMMLVEQPEFDTYSTTVPCAAANAQYNLRRGWTIQGNGINSTIIAISPSLDGSKCTGPNGTGNGCFFSVPTLTTQNLQLWGGGNSSLTGFSGKVGIFVPPLGVGTNFRFDNVALHGWGAGTSGFQGMNVGEHASTGISNGWFTNLNMEAFGYTELVLDPYQNGISGGGGGELFMTQSYVVTCGDFCVKIIDGSLNSSNNLFGQSTAAAGNVVEVESGALFNSTNDEWQFGNFSNTSMLYVSGSANLTNDQIYASGGAYGLAVNSGGAVNINQSVAISGTAANSLYVAGSVLDTGGNYYGGITVSGGGAIYGGDAFSASITYTTATSDSVSVTNVSSRSHCSLTPTNATAAASTVGAYISSIGAGTVTVTHVATTANGGTANITCTKY